MNKAYLTILITITICIAIICEYIRIYKENKRPDGHNWIIHHKDKIFKDSYICKECGVIISYNYNLGKYTQAFRSFAPRSCSEEKMEQALK